MATYQITYWHEIPSQVDAKAPGEKAHKEPLSPRFVELIDLVATKRKLGSADDYIAGWRKGDRMEKSGSPAEVARSVAKELEAQYDDIRARAIAHGSHAPDA